MGKVITCPPLEQTSEKEGDVGRSAGGKNGDFSHAEGMPGGAEASGTDLRTPRRKEGA